MNRREFAKNALLASTSLVSAKAGLSSLADRLTSEAGSNPLQFKKLFNGKDLTNFVDVNTSKETWFVEDGILKRSEERRVGKECRYRWSGDDGEIKGQEMQGSGAGRIHNTA